MKRKLKTIYWLDHFSDSAWKTKAEISEWVKKKTICVTTGEVTYEDKDLIVLSASYDGVDAYGENMCILKRNIVKNDRTKTKVQKV